MTNYFLQSFQVLMRCGKFLVYAFGKQIHLLF